MEKLKDPAIMLSVANMVGLVGTTAYFYKQLESLRADMVALSRTMQTVVKKLDEVQRTDQRKSELVNELDREVSRMSELVNELPSFELTDNIDRDLEEVYKVLGDNGMGADRPSQERSRRGSRSAGHRDRERERESRPDSDNAPRRDTGLHRRTRPSRLDSKRADPSEFTDSHNENSELIDMVRSRRTNDRT